MGYSAAQAVEDVVAAPPILDAHLDLGMYLRQERQKGRRQVFASDFLQDARESGVRGIVAAIFTDEQSINGSALQQACDQIAALQAEMCESPGQMKLCMTYADLMEAAASGQIAILLSFEGIEPLGGNAELQLRRALKLLRTNFWEVALKPLPIVLFLICVVFLVMPYWGDIKNLLLGKKKSQS